MSSNGPRWPLVLLSLGQVLHFVSAIEIVYPQGHTVYSAPPFGIAWTITPAESRDLDKINIYLTSYKVPDTVLVQMLWTTVNANSTRAQISIQPDKIPQGDHWRLSFHDPSSEFLDEPLAYSEEFSIEGATLTAQLASLLSPTPSILVDLSIPPATSSTETQITTKPTTSKTSVEPTPSTNQGYVAFKNDTATPHSTPPPDEPVHHGLSIGATTGIGVGITVTLFGLCAALCHMKANRRRATKAKAAAAATPAPEEDVLEYQIGKAISVDISRHTSLVGPAGSRGKVGEGRSVRLQRCPTVRMGTSQKLSSETPR
ncbi:hypothetical protein EG328_005440 [Venturia inaequalis]|uniref:Uncharacterized protein n=1 Tax=Venturia inaequalis TaxID=5025 RepID=A0A8H3YWL2_VENIN|nr:hypothetical protein EG328_005440 [Venturia inaequalis]